jgi:hypothetical protein
MVNNSLKKLKNTKPIKTTKKNRPENNCLPVRATEKQVGARKNSKSINMYNVKQHEKQTTPQAEDKKESEEWTA